MNILYFFGKRLSNGAKIKTRNWLDLSNHGLSTEKDWTLLQKTRKSNLKKSLKRMADTRDKYA